jgi:hypothetical protein
MNILTWLVCMLAVIAFFFIVALYLSEELKAAFNIRKASLSLSIEIIILLIGIIAGFIAGPKVYLCLQQAFHF